MKKLAVIPFLFLYVLSMSGVSVSAHYCCGKIASVRVSFAADKCASDKNKRCCNDITHFIKVRSSQQSAVSDITFNEPTLQLHTILPVINAWAALYSPNRTHNNFFFQSPPLQTRLPLFIRNESFLI